MGASSSSTASSCLRLFHEGLGQPEARSARRNWPRSSAGSLSSTAAFSTYTTWSGTTPTFLSPTRHSSGSSTSSTATSWHLDERPH